MVGEGEGGLEAIKKDATALQRVQALIAHIKLGNLVLSDARRDISETTIEDYCALKGIEEPQLPSLEEYLEEAGIEEPQLPIASQKTFGEKEAMLGLDVKTRARLHTLNATAAAIGTCIHPEGAFAVAREELMSVGNAPSELQAIGQVAMITDKRATVGQDKVDKVFFDLQARHRELEAEENRIKANLQQKQVEAALAEKEAYKRQLDAYHTELDAYHKATDKYYEEVEKPYLAAMSALERELALWKDQELEQLKPLCFSFPPEMKETLAEVVKY